MRMFNIKISDILCTLYVKFIKYYLNSLINSANIISSRLFKCVNVLKNVSMLKTKQNIRSPIKITVISSENVAFEFALLAG
jgi:hypothetical protein